MKKLLITLGLVFTASVFGQQPIVPPPVNPQGNFRSVSFINGSNVILTNNTTAGLNYGGTNIVYTQPNLVQVLSFGTNFVSPTLYDASGTNKVSNLDLAAFAYWTNTISTNGFQNNATNQLAGQAWSDVPIQSDRNGTALAGCISIVVSLDQYITNGGATAISGNATNNQGATNALSFVFDAIADGANPLATALAVPLASKSLLVGPIAVVGGGNNASNTVVITNLTANFVQGCSKIRLRNVLNANSNTNLIAIIKSVTYNGFIPPSGN